MIHLENRSPLLSDTDFVIRAARAALQGESAPPEAGLTIVLTDDDQLHALNREFLGVEAPTDVLAFPASEIPGAGEPDPETGAPYLGDVLLSVPRAAQQAQSAGHSLEDEVRLLVVHGVLHLMGHDHAGAEDKARMWAAQAEALERLASSGTSVHE